MIRLNCVRRLADLAEVDGVPPSLEHCSRGIRPARRLEERALDEDRSDVSVVIF